MDEKPAYTIDTSALNRYFWLTIDDGNEIIKGRRDALLSARGEKTCNGTCAKLKDLMKSGRIISHNEVRDEIRRAGSTAWNRWILENRKLFKGGATNALSKILNKVAEQDSDFLAEEKPGRAKHADPWVLAQAMHFKLIIIAVDGDLSKIAKKYGAEVIDPFDLIEKEKKLRPTLF